MVRLRPVLVVCVLAGLAATSVAHAYTLKYTDSGARIRWCVESAALRADPSIRGFLKANGGPRAVESAIASWQGLSGTPGMQLNNGVPSAPGYQSSGGSNGVYVLTEADWNARSLGGRLAVTITTYDSSTGCIYDADILVNSQHPFYLAEETAPAEGKADAVDGVASAPVTDVPDLIAVDSQSAYDLAAVLTHEFGHVEGLGETADFDFATMWPQIGMAEVHQRTLSYDDSDGVLAVYDGITLSAPVGCGGATIAGRANTHAWIPAALLALVLIAVALRWRAMNMQAVRLRGRARGTQTRAGLLFAAAALVMGPMTGATHTVSGKGLNHGANATRVRVARILQLAKLERGQIPAEKLREAARDAAPEVRAATAALLELRGSWEDRTVAAALTSDTDPRVSSVARDALVALEVAPPRNVLAVASPDGAARLAQAFDGASTPTVGRVVHRRTDLQNGLVYTQYELTDANGQHIAVRIPGGRHGRLIQQVGEASPPPDGAEIAVARRADGRLAWTHHAGDKVWGGWLEEGPGVIGVGF